MYKETEAEILEAAKLHKVNRKLLENWRSKGLVPRPKQIHLGRQGSKSLYPAGTVQQVIALCEIHKEKHHLSSVAWWLWWQGYEIPSHVIRTYISKALERFSIVFSLKATTIEP